MLEILRRFHTPMTCAVAACATFSIDEPSPFILFAGLSLVTSLLASRNKLPIIVAGIGAVAALLGHLACLSQVMMTWDFEHSDVVRYLLWGGVIFFFASLAIHLGDVFERVSAKRAARKKSSY